MSPPGLAWRSIVRQPARAMLGILGVAAVGALLFDMLLLSRGLVVSFSDLLEEVGFDIRVTSTPAVPFSGPRIPRSPARIDAIRSLPEVVAVTPLRLATASVADDDERLSVLLMGTGPGSRPYWTLRRGADLGGPGQIVINPFLSEQVGLNPGDRVPLVGECGGRLALGSVELEVVGIVDFPFDTTTDRSAAVLLEDLRRMCGTTDEGDIDLLLIASSPEVGSESAVRAIRAIEPDLHVFSNRQLLHRLSTQNFSYFRQISFVLATITVFFSFLLVTSLLTVSVNQRFAEIAALRAIGFSRSRVVADLLCESVALVGVGGLLALPVGGIVAVWLDGILKSMPGIPARVHFFAFEPRALVWHVVLLTVTGALAAAYPMWLAARLPIAATLRREVVS